MPEPGITDAPGALCRARGDGGAQADPVDCPGPEPCRNCAGGPARPLSSAAQSATIRRQMLRLEELRPHGCVMQMQRMAALPAATGLIDR